MKIGDLRPNLQLGVNHARHRGHAVVDFIDVDNGIVDAPRLFDFRVGPVDHDVDRLLVGADKGEDRHVGPQGNFLQVFFELGKGEY